MPILCESKVVVLTFPSWVGRDCWIDTLEEDGCFRHCVGGLADYLDDLGRFLAPMVAFTKVDNQNYMLEALTLQGLALFNCAASSLR